MMIRQSTSISPVVLLPLLLLLTIQTQRCWSLIPLLDGGKDIPKLNNGYRAYFDSQIAKQASAAVGAAIGSGKTNMEVYLPPVPNLEEVRFGTPLNKKFGQTIVAKDLSLTGGYYPGSDISRQQVAYANIYWAKQIAGAVSGGMVGGKPVTVVSSEPVSYDLIKNKGAISAMGPLRSIGSMKGDAAALIAINPGGEETWDRLRQASMSSKSGPLVVLNNSYSTSYGLGNQRNFEEVYYLKRISKGWVYRAYPGPWKAYLEKPDGSVEMLQSYKTKPQLNEVAKLVREESFKRYAINNDRWSPGFGERL